jgi:hypothetical protein
VRQKKCGEKMGDENEGVGEMGGDRKNREMEGGEGGGGGHEEGDHTMRETDTQFKSTCETMSSRLSEGRAAAL